MTLWATGVAVALLRVRTLSLHQQSLLREVTHTVQIDVLHSSYARDKGVTEPRSTGLVP